MSDEAPNVGASPEATKACPACGETIKAVALKCRFCGEDLQAFADRLDANEEKTLYAGRIPPFFSVGRYVVSVLTLGLGALYFWATSYALHLEITSQRIRVHRGILSRVTQNLELLRVDDIALEEPFGMRLVGTGVVRITSTDRDQHDIVLTGVPKPAALVEQLRRYNKLERQKSGVRVFTEA
ncbi:MAG: PH domain-containing protein [Polyangiales bacterium]|nr:PH domain-containing protein [Myxococcales bacterium]